MLTTELAIHRLLAAIYHKYDYDFRSYAYNSVQRRVLRRLELSNYHSFENLQQHVLQDSNCADQLLQDLSINVTEMFRDPALFRHLRHALLPSHIGQEHIKIWHAGCASGEEAFSMAILLHELQMLKQSQIYATDINTRVLNRAKEGILDIKQMQLNCKNYQTAGGKAAFTDYFHVHHGGAKFHHELIRSITFARHNLVGDASFGEMQIILCRNVLIYFNRQLQDRVLQLFADSLAPGGILCLGPTESTRLSRAKHLFEEVDNSLRIFRRKP